MAFILWAVDGLKKKWYSSKPPSLMDKNSWLAILVGTLVLLTGLFMGWCLWGNTPPPPPPPLYTVPPPSINVELPNQHIVTLTMFSPDPKIILLKNFLTTSECDALIQMGETHGFARSTVQGSNQNEVSSDRTSHTINFQRHQNDLISALEQRCTLFCPYEAINVENVQIVRYHPGQQYKHHYDFFVPGEEGTALALKRGGQRHMTFFVYLNDMSTDETGGQTDFPKLNLRVRPEKGMAVMWYNVKNNKEDFRTFHAGLPPLQSTKYGLNIWIRGQPFI